MSMIQFEINPKSLDFRKISISDNLWKWSLRYTYRERKFKLELKLQFLHFFRKIFVHVDRVLRIVQKCYKLISGDFRKSIWAQKKFENFPDILHMPTKSKRISLRFFFISENLKNLNYRSDLKMSQIFEFLLDFAHSEIWWSWIWKFSKKLKKSRFSTFWAPNLLQNPLSPARFSAAFLRCGAYSTSKMSKIVFSSHLSKKHCFNSIILRLEQNPTEIRWSSLKWNLSVPRKNSTFSHISSTFSWKCAVKWRMLL